MAETIKTTRIHPGANLRGVRYPIYAAAIKQMHTEGLYDMATGWRPESCARLAELLAAPDSEQANPCGNKQPKNQPTY